MTLAIWRRNEKRRWIKSYKLGLRTNVHQPPEGDDVHVMAELLGASSPSPGHLVENFN